MAAQEQALRTKWVRSTIDKVEGEDGKCRICGEWFETVKHVASGGTQLAEKQYMIRHDGVKNSLGAMQKLWHRMFREVVQPPSQLCV